MASLTLGWADHPPPDRTGGVVTLGNFDGVHRGHQALITTARVGADRLGGPVVAVTFDPPPFQVLYPSAVPFRPPLTTLADRSHWLHEAGADHVLILETSPALLALSPEAFFEDVLQRQLGAKGIVEGYDFRFGRGRIGTNALLNSLCLSANVAFEEVPPVRIDGEAVSSSRVRAALEAGDAAFARRLLGRPYGITGIVGTGAQRGRTIGFPTANLHDVASLLPAEGVYAVWAVVHGQRYAAAANIGPNPTFGEHTRKIEVHLLNFAGNLYDQPMSVAFVQHLRPTRPFAGAPALVMQLQQDIASARRVLDSDSHSG